MRTCAIIAVVVCLALADSLFAQLPPDSPNAADLYFRAAKLIVVPSPSDTADIYPGYPPYGKKWQQVEKEAFTKNAPVFDLVRRARSLDRADWTTVQPLNPIRSLINQLDEAAVYEHLQGDDAGAFETVQDALHMTTLMRQNLTSRDVVRGVVGSGCDAALCTRILAIAPEVRLSTDPNDTHTLQIGVAGQIINTLMDQTNPVIDTLGPNKTAAVNDPTLLQMNETFCRCNAERTFAAMSLAAELYRFDQHQWPKTLDDLVPAYLPGKAIDPWGDGAQTFGYVLVKGGLPDGGDRPLVYDRCWSNDGLFYRIDEPEYYFYIDDGTTNPAALQKHGGQFRDLAIWHPVPRPKGAPTTHALN